MVANSYQVVAHSFSSGLAGIPTIGKVHSHVLALSVRTAGFAPAASQATRKVVCFCVAAAPFDAAYWMACPATGTSQLQPNAELSDLSLAQGIARIAMTPPGVEKHLCFCIFALWELRLLTGMPGSSSHWNPLLGAIGWSYGCALSCTSTPWIFASKCFSPLLHDLLGNLAPSIP